MNTFHKEERLCSRKYLDLLFKNGSSFLLYPFRISYLFLPEPAEFPAQIVINVAKKRYKRAVDRNLLKRRIREVYRIHKQELLYKYLEQPDRQLLLAVQFIGKQKYEFSFMEKKLCAALKKLTTGFENVQDN